MPIEDAIKDLSDSSKFKPGLWRHYKGGMYVALYLVHHHETRSLMVVYVSMTLGSINVREWATPGADSWTDVVRVPTTSGGGLTYDEVPRFAYVKPTHASG